MNLKHRKTMSIHEKRGSETDRMEYWEYKQVMVFPDFGMLTLNGYGKEGWEAFSAFKDGNNTTVFMKRRLRPR